jgi:hypothetical protein
MSLLKPMVNHAACPKEAVLSIKKKDGIRREETFKYEFFEENGEENPCAKHHFQNDGL